MEQFEELRKIGGTEYKPRTRHLHPDGQPKYTNRLFLESKEILYQLRSHRPPPLRDEKILTAWNGLMISAHAQAGLILGDSHYVARAVKAAQFVLDKLYAGDRLFRSYKDDTARHNGYLDDYAFFIIAALLDLHEATHDPQWLKKAIEMDAILEHNYEDTKHGGFFHPIKKFRSKCCRLPPIPSPLGRKNPCRYHMDSENASRQNMILPVQNICDKTGFP